MLYCEGKKITLKTILLGEITELFKDIAKFSQCSQFIESYMLKLLNRLVIIEFGLNLPHMEGHFC